MRNTITLDFEENSIAAHELYNFLCEKSFGKPLRMTRQDKEVVGGYVENAVTVKIETNGNTIYKHLQ